MTYWCSRAKAAVDGKEKDSFAKNKTFASGPLSKGVRPEILLFFAPECLQQIGCLAESVWIFWIRWTVNSEQYWNVASWHNVNAKYFWFGAGSESLLRLLCHLRNLLQGWQRSGSRRPCVSQCQYDAWIQRMQNLFQMWTFQMTTVLGEMLKTLVPLERPWPIRIERSAWVSLWFSEFHTNTRITWKDRFRTWMRCRFLTLLYGYMKWVQTSHKTAMMAAAFLVFRFLAANFWTLDCGLDWAGLVTFFMIADCCCCYIAELLLKFFKC